VSVVAVSLLFFAVFVINKYNTNNSIVIVIIHIRTFIFSANIKYKECMNKMSTLQCIQIHIICTLCVQLPHL